MTREQHIAWCKERALAYLPQDLPKAFGSMLSDIERHPETRGHSGCQLGKMLLMTGGLDTERTMRAFIEGFK